MIKILILALFMFGFSFAKDYLIPMENTVGYIEDNKGRKFIVVESQEGARLIPVKKNPEKIINKDLGISKEEMKMSGD
ncbi:MAG TPA: hypothetical protein EYH43_05385 [Persephonella sp.]|nr:hypothetical protein [Hydrogenothermaceae bacterium]HIQ25396.1 hypothetical protein [Persephonella sp.]